MDFDLTMLSRKTSFIIDADGMLSLDDRYRRGVRTVACERVNNTQHAVRYQYRIPVLNFFL